MISISDFHKARKMSKPGRTCDFTELQDFFSESGKFSPLSRRREGQPCGCPSYAKQDIKSPCSIYSGVIRLG
jgi:hypothetical protein